MISKLYEEFVVCNEFDQVMVEYSKQSKVISKKLGEVLSPFFTCKEAISYEFSINEIWDRIIGENFDPEFSTGTETNSS